MREKSGEIRITVVAFVEIQNMRRMALTHLVLRELNTSNDGWPDAPRPWGPQRAIAMSIPCTRSRGGSAITNYATPFSSILEQIRCMYINHDFYRLRRGPSGSSRPLLHRREQGANPSGQVQFHKYNTTLENRRSQGRISGSFRDRNQIS